MTKSRHPANRLARAMTKAMGGDASAGLLLIGVAVAAVILANSPLEHAYHALFHAPLGWSPIPKLDTLHLWINDGLMAVFFFVVGLEIKREVLQGELSDARKRRLPVAAAVAGMAAPALVYLLIAGTAQPLSRGWAIPAATDIAFAVGVLGLAGKGLPSSLRLFLLSVAIVDDLGAVAIIALFYTASIDLTWGLGALAFFAAMIAANRAGLARLPIYLLLSLGLWFCLLHSGVHATIAGVLAALTIPLHNNARGDSMLLRLEHALVPWNSYLIVPLFGFANAGVTLGGGSASLAGGLPLAVALGLFVGKQAGVLGALFACRKLEIAPLPKGASWLQLWGLALLCGVGFTMSLFIGALAFPDHPELVVEAKLGVLAGSLLSSLLGFAILRWTVRSGGAASAA
jgi:NhaA family Na+:H+ antiporter